MILLDALHLFEESLYDGHVKESTRRWYIWFDDNDQIHGQLQSIYKFFGNVQVEEITVFDINRWVKGLHATNAKYEENWPRPAVEGALSLNTINGHITSARRFFGWLHDMGLIEKNPTITLRRIPIGERTPKAISTEDFLRLLKEAKQSRYPERNLAILTFLFDTGCRVAGLCSVKMEDLDIPNRRIYVFEKGRGASGKGRWIFLETVPFLCLMQYMETRPQDRGDFLFVGEQMQGLTSSGVYQMIERLANNVGLERGVWNPHSFRHAAAREWLRGGASLPAVSQLLGHSDISVTAMYYARWAHSELQGIKSEASPFGGSLANVVCDVVCGDSSNS